MHYIISHFFYTTIPCFNTLSIRLWLPALSSPDTGLPLQWSPLCCAVKMFTLRFLPVNRKWQLSATFIKNGLVAFLRYSRSMQVLSKSIFFVFNSMACYLNRLNSVPNSTYTWLSTFKSLGFVLAEPMVIFSELRSFLSKDDS